MRAAHFDCFSGISGDMTLGALIDAGVDADAVRAGLDSLGLPIRLEVEKIRKGGFAATRATVEAPEEHVHRYLADVEEIVSRGRLTDRLQRWDRRLLGSVPVLQRFCRYVVVTLRR